MTNLQIKSLSHRVLSSFVHRWRHFRSFPALNPSSMIERWLERQSHSADPAHRPHLDAAIDWLVAAQDATPDDGFARGFSLAYSAYFGSAGWQPSYPETTGYIIPTLLEAARYLPRPGLVDRAIRAARWECEIQLDDGAVQGGVIGQGRSPAVFNTGQVMLGWISALEETGDPLFEAALRRAGDYLVAVMQPDGHWRKGNSRFARGETTLYNARVAWALAEAGARLNVGSYRDAAAKNLRAVAAEQKANGWFPNCCLTDPARPLLHTLAYTIRGLLEGGRVLQDTSLITAAARASEALRARVRPDGFMPGRFNSDWSAAVDWSCLTGEAQMANNWMRLSVITEDKRWVEPVSSVLQFLKRTQNRTTDLDGLRGGIKGSYPMSGGYGRFELLNWATKYFADALMRHDQILAGTASPRESTFLLA
jgi:hypothetical protein